MFDNWEFEYGDKVPIPVMGNYYNCASKEALEKTGALMKFWSSTLEKLKWCKEYLHAPLTYSQKNLSTQRYTIRLIIIFTVE